MTQQHNGAAAVAAAKEHFGKLVEQQLARV